MGYETLTRQLDAIEAELRQLGWLTGEVAQQPAPVTSAFGMNDMTFEHWLSRVFLPAVRNAIAGKDLPSESNVGTAAIRNLDGNDDAAELVSMLCEFDAEVERVAGTDGADG